MGTTNSPKFIPPNAFYPVIHQCLPPPKFPSIWYYSFEDLHVNVDAAILTKLIINQSINQSIIIYLAKFEDLKFHLRFDFCHVFNLQIQCMTDSSILL